MLLLNNGIINFLLVCIDFTIAKDLVACVFFFDWLYLAFIHVIMHDHFLFLKIHCHFGYLLFCWEIFVLLKHLSHLFDANLTDMVIVVVIVLRCIYFITWILRKSDAPADHSLILIFIQFCGLLSNFFNSFDQSIMVSVWIIRDNSHPSIDLNDLLPVWHFARPIKLNCFELVRIPIPPF